MSITYISQIKLSLLRRIARITVGILMAVQTVGMLGFATFLGMFIPALGGMAMIVGGNKATDEQHEQAWFVIKLMAVAPLLVVLLSGVITWLVLRNRRPIFLYISTGIALALYITLANFLMEGDWSHVRFDGLLPILLPLTGAALVTRPGELPDSGVPK